MKCNHPAVCLVLAFLATLVLAGPTDAGEQVPFKGRLEGVVTVTPLTPPFMFVLVEGSGNATHLGRLTWVAMLVASPVEAAGTFQFTAANGDMLFADFTGHGTPTATPGVLDIEDHATITGGTGRFAHATGSFISERLFDTVSGTTIGSFKGTLRLRDEDDDDEDDD
jgi:hypothetical protein